MTRCMHAALWFLFLHAAAPASNPVLAPLDGIYPQLDATYRELHASPELSLQEVKTAANLAEKLRALGFEVTTGVGGHGVVGVMKNGKGPTVLVRTDLDGLPMEEKTGLEYASKVTAVDKTGATVSVMHGCGHDVHMTAWYGTAMLLSRAKNRWRGTLVMIGQPAEELGTGAKAMLADGLFTRFPRPDFAIGIHDTNEVASGSVSWVSGYALANVDSIDVTVYGRGGHGAYPHLAIDPIVIAARTVVALQTVVARENDPLEPAVVTVGSIHGGTKHNIIPDEVKLQLTVRSYSPEVREKLIASITRIVKAEAAAAGATKEPLVALERGPSATWNDPALTKRLATVLTGILGDKKVVEGKPRMGAEDFSEFGRAGVPAAILWVGAADPAKLAAAERAGASLPPLHSSQFAPEREATLRTGVIVLTAGALELLAKP